MQREISYEWSPEIVRRGVKRFLFRYISRSLVVFTAILIPAIVALATGHTVCFWWGIVILYVFYINTWFRYYQQTIKTLTEMPDRRVTLRIEPENITVETSDYTTTMKWSRITGLWRYPELLLLFTYDIQVYWIIPVDPLGSDGVQFIEEQVKSHGGKVA